ncbi:MAG: NUDIX hydrolase [Anaerolinea sp.]|nr:NUDIX hydrolase [Anaerolinea sp.]
MADILPLLEEIAAIGRIGLTYATNVYDRERYEQLIGLAARWYGQSLDIPPDDARERLALDLKTITPKVGADAAIFDSDGRILLMKRTDNKRWCMPCGLEEVGESPAHCATREAKEETGLDVRIVQLVDVFTRLPSAEYTPYTLVSVLYLCEVTGGELRSSREDLGLQYWHIEDVPEWHGAQQAQAIAAREAWRNWFARR